MSKFFSYNIMSDPLTYQEIKKIYSDEKKYRWIYTYQSTRYEENKVNFVPELKKILERLGIFEKVELVYNLDLNNYTADVYLNLMETMLTIDSIIRIDREKRKVSSGFNKVEIIDVL